MKPSAEKQSISALSGVKSRPVSAPLCADLNGRSHLLVGGEPGIDALLRVLGELAPQALPTEVYWLGDVPDQLAACTTVRGFAGQAELARALEARLSQAGMGLRVYLAGREAFIWTLSLPLIAAGLREDEIQREACGSKARRVFCVHCRDLLEQVTTNPVTCPGCGTLLEVRDHFSRAMAAYIGVVVNAEDPDDVPDSEELFV